MDAESSQQRTQVVSVQELRSDTKVSLEQTVEEHRAKK